MWKLIKPHLIGLALGILILGIIVGWSNSYMYPFICENPIKRGFLWFNPTHAIGAYIGCSLK